MTTLHRIPSIRLHNSSTFRALFTSFTMLIVWSCVDPAIVNAQQTGGPVYDTACQCGGPALTSVATNAGTNFLLCFEQNIDTNFDAGFSSSSYLEIYFAALGDTATVTISCRAYPFMKKVFFLQPNGSKSYRVTDDTLNEDGVIVNLHDLWVISDEVPDNVVVEVQATSPIVCYGMDFKLNSADAFCAISKESAGTEYGVMSYPNSQTATPNTASQFAVAAFYDSTTVTITPSARTLGGNAAGVPFTVMLQEGQCVQVETNPDDSGLDLTGSMVFSNHPTTVYSGHQRTEAPRFWIDTSRIDGGGSVSRDMLLETMPPTSTWGEEFVVNPIDLDINDSIAPGGDVMRVLALNDGTSVTVNGKPWVTLNHGQFMDTMVAVPTLVESSGPLLVGEIEHSDCYIGNGGDPSLSIVPPIDQTYNNFTFFTSPDNLNFQYNGVIIATDTSSQGTISVDGRPLPRFFFKPVPGTIGGRSFSVYEDQLETPGAHTITSTMPPEQGFTILAYGLGDVISYGYTAGSLLVPKRAIMIEFPPATNRPIHTNTLNFHNTAYQPAYLDSATFIPDDFKNAAFGIHTAEDVALDIGRVDIGGSGQVHLVSDIPLNYPVSGTLNIFSHLPSYFNIEPAQMHFTLYPDAADVAQAGQIALNLTATPNPFSAYTTINFSVPQTGDITVTLYDELGRIVKHVASREFTAGPYSFQIERNGLPNGVYVCEVTSAQLNIHARIPIVAGE